MKILYIRSGPYILNINGYNVQEIGLAKSIYKSGHSCDILYYSKQDKDEIIYTDNYQIKILWRWGIKLFRSGIYPSILNKEFLNTYDVIIVSEYSQIMSVLISVIHPVVYIYNGPYYNLFKIPFMEKVYDNLFVNYLNKHIVKIFCKTRASESYLREKGFQNIETIGVGLDIDKIENKQICNDETNILVEKMKNRRNILYVGSIIERKNTEFLINVFKKIREFENNKDVQLVLIGNGDKNYINKCLALLTDEDKEKFLYSNFIENSQLKFIYAQANLFILPSIHEIFGMVLLEAMYCNVAVLSSRSAGAETLIENEYNGFLFDCFDVNKWAETANSIINSEKLSQFIGNNAHMTIVNSFKWDIIAKKILNSLTNEVK